MAVLPERLIDMECRGEVTLVSVIEHKLRCHQGGKHGPT
jgi:hypothetical protein